MSKINIPDFSNARIKDEVWDAVTNEFGYIFQISRYKGALYPISVRFPDGESRTYTFAGRDDTDDEFPRLFWRPFEIPKECLTRPADRRDLQIDDKILVRQLKDSVWLQRHFAGWSDDGRAKSFLCGKTSWSGGETMPWDEWKLPTEEMADLVGGDKSDG